MIVPTDDLILLCLLAVIVVVFAYMLHSSFKQYTVFRFFEYNEPRLYNVSLKDWIEVKTVTGDIYYVRKKTFEYHDTYFFPDEYKDEVRVYKSSIASCKEYSRGTGSLDVGEEAFSVVVVGDNKKNPHTFIFDHESEDRIKKGSKIEINSIQGYITNDKVTGIDIHYGLVEFYTINYNKEEK